MQNLLFQNRNVMKVTILCMVLIFTSFNVLSQMPDYFYEEDRTDEPPQERETI